MTADVRAGETPSVPAILAICDRLLGEIGRRSHLFGWLRDPDAGPQRWLAVDAYYPRHRLVVLCREPGSPHEQLYAEQIPGHGLHLLSIDPAELSEEREGPHDGLERRIAALGELRPPRPAEIGEQVPRESVVARAMATFSQPVSRPPAPAHPLSGQRAQAAERAARFVSARQALPRPLPAPRPTARPTVTRLPVVRGPSAVTAKRVPRPIGLRRSPEPAPLRVPSLIVGLALAAVLCAEIIVGVAGVALSAGHLVLAFGIAIDCCARALGTIAAVRAGRPHWVWLCLVGGSPAVAAFALFQEAGPVDEEPAPLAGLLALLACGVVGVALAAWALGI